MVRCGQLTSKECLRFIFTKMDRVPRVYNDAVLAKLDVLADELERFSTAGAIAFWSNIVHSKPCQKCLVSCAENLPRLYEMKFIVDEYRESIKKLSIVLRNIFMRIVSQKEIEDTASLDLSSFLDLYVISDLASNFGHIPSFKKGLTILVSRTKNLPAKIYDYEVMASSALNDVIERFEVVDKLNTKGLVDLYSSGLDIISSLHSLSIADSRIAELLAEPFDDPESKKERFLFVKIAELFELITKHVSNKLEEVFYYQVYSILFSLKLTQTVFTSRFLKEKIYEEDAEVFLLLCHALLSHKVFLCDLKENLSMLDIMLKMKSAFPKTVKDDQVKWFMEDAKEASKAPKVKMSAEASQIREIYPDLGSEFISKLLAYYKNNVQEVMIALLEENLPPQLASLDRTAETKVEPEKPKLVIPGLYHKKAKTKRVDHAKEEEERQYIRKIAMNYQYTEDVEIVEVAEDETGAKYQTSKEYGDEYDDTYDDAIELGEKVEYDVVKPADLAIDSDLQKNSNHQNLIKRKAKGRVQDEAESNSSDSRPQSRSDRVSAPVSASAYYKQVWQEKHKNEKEPGGPPPPKGKLTEDATDLQKRRKDVNKARVGNHNRKKMAMKKQSRGMTSNE